MLGCWLVQKRSFASLKLLWRVSDQDTSNELPGRMQSVRGHFKTSIQCENLCCLKVLSNPDVRKTLARDAKAEDGYRSIRTANSPRSLEVIIHALQYKSKSRWSRLYAEESRFPGMWVIVLQPIGDFRSHASRARGRLVALAPIHPSTMRHSITLSQRQVFSLISTLVKCLRFGTFALCWHHAVVVTRIPTAGKKMPRL